MSDKKFSINVVEKLYREDVGDEMDEWFHAYLMLTEGTIDSQKIIQELHFNEGKMGAMIPNLRDKNIALETDKSMSIFPYVSGDAADILSMWNHALRHAIALRDDTNGPTFGYDYRHCAHANNCRTGVKALIQTMGMTFCDEFTKAAAGMTATGVPVGKAFSFAQAAEESFEKLYNDNRLLAQSLPSLATVQIMSAQDIASLEHF